LRPERLFHEIATNAPLRADLDPLGAHVFLQNFGNSNATIFLLIIFHHSNQSSSHSQSTSIQGMNKLWLTPTCWTEANVGSASLEIFKVTARADFTIGLRSREWFGPSVKQVVFLIPMK
jgi:hypothetical protein